MRIKFGDAGTAVYNCRNMSLSSEIRNSLKELISDALTAIQKLWSPPPPPWQLDQQRPVIGHDSLPLTVDSDRELFFSTLRVVDDLEVKPVFDQFRKALEADPLTGKQVNTLVGTFQSRCRLTADGIFLSVLIRYLERNDKQLDFCKRVFGQVYEDLSSAFESPTFEVRYRGILENIELRTGPIDLDPGMVIRPLRPTEPQELLGEPPENLRSHAFSFDAVISRGQPKAVIETTIQAQKVIGEVPFDRVDRAKLPSSKAAAEFDLVITALTLLKHGTVKLGTIAWKRGDILDRGLHSSSPLGVSLSGANPYVLLESDVDNLKALWRTLRGVDFKRNRSLDIGIRRLRLASQRSSVEDIIIDTMIAFEALILADAGSPEERGELRHRLSVRAAHLVGKTPDEMKRYYRIVKKAYDLRSRLVHGGMLKPRDSQWVQLAVDLCRQTARELLLLQSDRKAPEWDAWLFE